MTLNWSYLQAAIKPAPQHRPRSMPSLAGSFWFMHQQVRELRLALKQASSGDPNLGFSSFIRQGLCYLSLFTSPLELNLFREETLPSFHCFRTFLIPFSLVVRRIRLGRQKGWRRGKLSLSSLLRCLALRLRLHDIQKTSFGLMLYPHGFWDGRTFLGVICRRGNKVAEVTSWGFRG